ncbi:MAG: hypothetical protein QM757_26400 [Paludibaculum sp.]
MALPGFSESPMLPLRGAWKDMDQIQPDLVRGRAFEAQNIRIQPQGALCREGHTAGFAVPGRTTSLFQWLPTVALLRKNWLFYLANGSVYFRDPTTADPATALYASPARSLSYAEAGDKLYIAHANDSNIGTEGLKIADPQNMTQRWADAFGGPGTINPTAAEVGGGTMTAGLHHFGYIIEYRSGRSSPPGPVNAGTGAFVPFSYTVTGPGKKVLLTVTFPMTPNDIAFLHPIVTRVDNLNNWFFMPSGSVAVPPGAAAWPVTMTYDMADEDLANRAESALDYFNLITRTVGGAPPIQPSSCCVYGNRLVLYCGTKVYISDPFKYEYITEARHVVQVPGAKEVLAGGVVGGVLYHFGPNYTYASAATADDPRSWPQPDKISGALGVASASAMDFRSTQDMGWVANRSGLWPFRGQFPDKPTTCLWRTYWRSINSAVGHKIVVREDPDRQIVYVAAPMGSATEPSHLWVVDYSRRRGPVRRGHHDRCVRGVLPQLHCHDRRRGHLKVYLDGAGCRWKRLEANSRSMGSRRRADSLHLRDGLPPGLLPVDAYADGASPSRFERIRHRNGGFLRESQKHYAQAFARLSRVRARDSHFPASFVGWGEWDSANRDE